MAIDYTRINWKNEPNETTPLSAENLNKMDKAIDDLVTDVNSLEPNPVDEATEGLEKLAYGGTVYEVKGGHKIVNDNGVILPQKDNMKFGGVYSHNSGTITVVDTVREFNSVSDIENLTGEEAKGFQYLDDDVYDEFTAGDIGFDNSDTSFVGTNVQDVLEEVDTKIDEIADYSETEKVVGKWIDGKPLYQKTVDCGALPSNTLKDVAHNISNIKFVVDIKGVALTNNNQCIPVPYAYSSNGIKVIQTSVDSTNIRISDMENLTVYTKTYLTIKYTKTTD